MRNIPAGQFKSQCLALMEEVERTHEPIVVTKRGKPMVKLVPAEPERDDLVGSWKDKARITGNVISPAFDESDWDCLR